MKQKRTWPVALSAFTLTLCVLLTAGGFLLVGLRSGRTLFGEAYEPVTWQQDTPVDESQQSGMVWLPARLRLLVKIPEWEAEGLEWLLSR